MTKPESPQLLASVDVCKRLYIDRSTLSRWVKAGKIAPAMRLPGASGALLFAPGEVERVAGATA